MRTMKHLAIAAIAASALALAGCGGGSSSSTMVAPPATPTTPTTPSTPDEPTTPTSTAVTLPSDGNDYLAEADLALEDQMISLATGESEDVGVYTLTCTAGPCEITIADGEVTATGDVSADYTMAAMDTIKTAKMVMMAENSGRSSGMLDALTDATGTRGQAILAGAKDNDLEIMRGMSGGAMVTDGQLGGKSGWTTAMADSAISGFEGHKLTRKTEKIVVYTDIAAAKHKAFLTHYPDSTTAIAGATVSIAGGVVSLDAAAMVATGDAGLLDPSKFPQPKDEGEGVNTYTYDDMEGAGKKSSTFKGTFHGAPGRYACAAADCVVQVSDRSTASAPAYDATATTGDWTFTPDTANNPRIVNQDTDHMHFGWWVNTPAKAAAEGQYLYDAEMFYGGSSLFPDGDIDALDGDADYSGPAAGLFAVTGENAAHGEFTATAKLTAAFGNTSDPGAVSGTISDFVRDDGVNNAWSVTLGSSPIVSTTQGGDDGPIMGGSNDRIGAWEYRLYGPSTNGKDPSGIAGSFRAKIDANTAVAGAFATK